MTTIAPEFTKKPTFENGDITLEDVQLAAERLRHLAHVTPVMTSRTLNEMTGKKLFMKCELFQRTGSFKFRGAVNAVSHLLEQREEKPAVVAHSCGNHGAALACAAQMMGTRAYIVLPNTVSEARRQAVQSYGATVIESDPEYPKCEAHVAEIVRTTGAVYIPTSQHADVVAGQGTIALEFLQEVLTQL